MGPGITILSILKKFGEICRHGPALSDAGESLHRIRILLRIYATRFRRGRTVSCIPIAFRTALRLLSSGLPFGESVR